MSKRNKGTHGIYDLTCISHKCSRRFKVIWDVRRVSALQQSKWAAEANVYNPKPAVGYTKLTYPFNGCPFCGAWWPTGPLDAGAYPQRTPAPKSWVTSVGSWSHISTNKGTLYYQSLVSAGLRGLGFKSWAH